MTEEIKDVELEDDALKTVSGGSTSSDQLLDIVWHQVRFQCPNTFCNREYYWKDAKAPSSEECPDCDKCGTKMFVSAVS